MLIDAGSPARSAGRLRRPFSRNDARDHPLTANQVASVHDWIITTREVTVTDEPRTYTRQGKRSAHWRSCSPPIPASGPQSCRASTCKT